ncbi:hypothetical protein E2P81_ATG11050 [Venturia nashicola]|uniref:Uncharacterized protein n=1 Tax=Venturia nashicola TaxID=86259 RepID=A0A4Z1P7T1_9PEZI|nr:hypothetical protein E6O75_ATG10728 [Venturia nashicola]TLD27762.1 hypothetical protein E2P81_ATG11050 [Venturia nashicola]
MKLLTRILSHQPSPVHPYDSSTQAKYRDLTRKDIERLPVHLRKESGQGKSLCKMHAGLNSGVIRSIFGWIHKQVDLSVGLLTDPTGAEVSISDEVMEPFLHLLNIRSMWTPSSSSFFMRRQNKPDKRWAPQQDGCKACMLARLGGEEDIITPLRASIVAKLSAEDKPKSRRLVWMAALIHGCFVEEVFQRIMDKSESLARSLRTANTEAAFKMAKCAEYWNSTAISPAAGHTQAASRNIKTTRQRPDAAHIVDVAKDVSPITDEMMRVERHAKQEFREWQAQQLQARRKEKRRSVSPVSEKESHLPQTVYNSFDLCTRKASDLYTRPELPIPTLASPFATPSPPPLRPKTSHTGKPHAFHAYNNPLTVPSSSPERPRTSHAAEARRAPPPLPASSRGSRVPSFLLRRKTPKPSFTEPSPNTAPSPPPKDMSTDLPQHVDTLYRASHPIQSPPPVPPKSSPPKHTLLPRLNTNTQQVPRPHHLIPLVRTERTSSVYSQSLHLNSPPQLNGQLSPPNVRGIILDNTEAMRDGMHRSTMRRHYEMQRNSPDSASTSTPIENSWKNVSHTTPLPTPDSAEEYRQLISGQETQFLASTQPVRFLNFNSTEMGMGRWKSKNSLDSVDEGNESLSPTEENKERIHRKVDSRSKFRPLSPSHMRRQFDPSVKELSLQSVIVPPRLVGGYVIGKVAGNNGHAGEFGSQEKEFGPMRARFRPHVSPVDHGEYRTLVEGQRKEMEF